MEITVRNWSKFQHYKHRSPPWIRVYGNLLDDPDWYNLSDSAKAFLIQTWLFVSQNGTDGTLRDSAALARRLHIDSKTLQSLISECKQWLEYDASITLADCKQSASPEQSRAEQSRSEQSRDRAETIVRRRKKAPPNEYDSSFDRFWHFFPKKQGKRHAWAAWQEATKRASVEEITAGAARLSQDVASGRKNIRFCKMPQTWLNADGWLDEPDPEFKPEIDFDDPFDERRPDDTRERRLIDRKADPVLPGPSDGGASYDGGVKRPAFFNPDRET